MDIGDINKVASRKKMNAEAEKLREKVSRETAKIIKLKVAQDTAYWDLKEKLHQVEQNHERLQQNMVEVQMQHEAISGQYQDELRLRPETLNKLSSTREISSLLEEYSSRLKDTLSRCQADHATLATAYHRSGQLVREAKLQQAQINDSNRQLIQGLEDKVKSSSEQQSHLVEYLTAAKQQTDNQLSEARDKLESAAKQREEMIAIVAELNRRLDQHKFELDKKNESIATLQKDMKQLIHEFNAQSNDMKSTMLKQEKDLKETKESNESLKRALNNQDVFTKSICEQNTQLQDKVSALEDEHLTMAKMGQELEAKLQEVLNMNNNLEMELASFIQKKEELEKENVQKDKILEDLKTELQTQSSQLAAMEMEKAELASKLASALEDTQGKIGKIEEMTTLIQELEKNVAEAQTSYKEYSAQTEQKLKDLTSTITLKDKELDSKASTINQLMCEVKTGSDARFKLEETIARIREELEAEKRSGVEKERKYAKQVEQLEVVIRNKEDELSKQMSIILEMRNEKDRLQQKIESMQKTIDNIQKELTGRVASLAPRLQPEQDDNAVVLTPRHREQHDNPPAKVAKTSEFAVPRNEPKQLDSMLYNLFSDSSMDGDMIDCSEVNRRFEALSRGERVAAVPLASLKRRSAVPATQGGLKIKTTLDDDAPISLSQVKNDLKNKERSFFKNKRHDVKGKKK